MAANFWESTQWRYWQFTKEELASMRQKVEDEDPSLVQMYPLPEWRHMNIYFNQQILKLGRKIGLRQQAAATAQMYIKRFYTKVEVRRTNPLVVAITAVYLACKMEEMPQHIRHMVHECRSLWPAELHTLDVAKMGECEFFLISEMHSQLIIHQPYRTLNSLEADFQLSAEEQSLAWSIINDHYMTDLPLLYPPHIIALTAILLALQLRPSNPGGSQGATGSGTVSPGGMNLMTATAIMQQTAARAAILGGGNGGGASAGATHSPTGQSQQIQQQQQQQQQQQSQAQGGSPSKLQRFTTWLAESAVDIEAMIDCSQELIAFYECHEQYNDKNTRDQINRFVKARGL